MLDTASPIHDGRDLALSVVDFILSKGMLGIVGVADSVGLLLFFSCRLFCSILLRVCSIDWFPSCEVFGEDEDDFRRLKLKVAFKLFFSFPFLRYNNHIKKPTKPTAAIEPKVAPATLPAGAPASICLLALLVADRVEGVVFDVDAGDNKLELIDRIDELDRVDVCDEFEMEENNGT